VHVMTTNAGLNRLGISMYWIFPFCGLHCCTVFG
jgi:hypothetical protein